MKYVCAAVLIVAFATPAFAGRACTIMTHAPNPKKYKMMGKYGTRAEANKAITESAECH